MKAIVLGMGLQGKAVIHDLESIGLIKEIFAADIFPSEQGRAEAEAYIQKKGYSKTRTIKLDVFREKDLPMAFSARDVNVVICMLPVELAHRIAPCQARSL